MAEFIEVPIEKEDGSAGLQFVNLEAISYVDTQSDREGKGSTLTVYLNSGYWFTLSGTKADEVLQVIRDRRYKHFKGDARDN